MNAVLDMARAAPLPDLDSRIAAAFAEGMKSVDAARLLAEVKEAAAAAELAAETARKHALDPLLSGDDLKLARGEMQDAIWTKDRLQEASARLTLRVESLRAREVELLLLAEHDRLLGERGRLAKEIDLMADPIARIAQIVSQISNCDHEIKQLNVKARGQAPYIPPVLSRAEPIVQTLLEEFLIMDTFITIARRWSAGAKDKPHVAAKG